MVKQEILKVAKERHINVKIMEFEKAIELLRNIVDKYTKHKVHQYPLWEYLKSKQSIYTTDGWKFIDIYNTNKEVILFLEPNDGDNIFFVFKSIQAIKEVLEHSFGFVFYITDFMANFLLCFNEHDYLIACGDAIRVIDDLNGSGGRGSVSK